MGKRTIVYVDDFIEGEEYLCPTCHTGLVSMTCLNPDDLELGTYIWKNPPINELQCDRCQHTFQEYELKILVERVPE